MITREQVDDVIRSEVYGSDGEKIGKVGQLYFDDASGRPEWITVSTGFFGSRESFVPLADADLSGDRVTVPYDKDKIKNAPNVESEDGHISETEERELYRHYGVDYAESSTDTYTTGVDTGVDRDRDGVYDDVDTAVGRDTSGPTTDDAMTRSEERLSVDKEKREAGRARLRKYVVTEQVQQTVPVTREEVRIEREPITDANRGDAMGGPDLSEEEHEVTLYEERAVVEKETVPVERVRLSKEQVTEEQTVSEQVRKEQIETDAGDSTTDRTTDSSTDRTTDPTTNR
ncbi:MAG: PRC and DUF2382 domain-containing protein [Acidothermales bacterium]|jgi:uncharacterized protein (TIGR02271 family)|nr:PRC and DUF2382 domain-containing protein [Acidothermales bacterium]